MTLIWALTLRCEEQGRSRPAHQPRAGAKSEASGYQDSGVGAGMFLSGWSEALGFVRAPATVPIPVRCSAYVAQDCL